MKKFLIFLVIILIVSIIVLPLIFVAIGKLRNPVDSLSDRINGGNSAPGAGGLNSRPLVSQNYIPQSGGVGDPESARQRIETLDKELTDCIGSATSLINYTYGIKPKEGEKNIIELPFNTNWYLNDYTLGDSKPSPKSYLGLSIKQLKTDRVCKRPEIEYYGNYHDSGTFAKKDVVTQRGFTNTNRGVIGVNRSRYHWYLYESNTKLDLTSTKNSNSYIVIYATIFGGAEYVYTITGDTDIYPTANGFLRKTQAMLTNIKYGDVSRVQSQ
jgi:hypothetical protein